MVSECNICFEIGREPIVTHCGHLFCWPCLYKWLNFHSKSRQCPVCKVPVDETKWVPLYGGLEGDNSSSSSISTVDPTIPSRASVIQRNQTIPQPPYHSPPIEYIRRNEYDNRFYVDHAFVGLQSQIEMYDNFPFFRAQYPLNNGPPNRQRQQCDQALPILVTCICLFLILHFIWT